MRLCFSAFQSSLPSHLSWHYLNARVSNGQAHGPPISSATADEPSLAAAAFEAAPDSRAENSPGARWIRLRDRHRDQASADDADWAAGRSRSRVPTRHGTTENP